MFLFSFVSFCVNKNLNTDKQGPYGQWLSLIKCIVTQTVRLLFAEKWYCSKGCGEKAGRIGKGDGVLNYAKAVVWQGVNHLARRRLIRNGDGPGMVEYWQLDMLEFWKHKNYKYAILAHDLLTGEDFSQYCSMNFISAIADSYI